MSTERQSETTASALKEPLRLRRSAAETEEVENLRHSKMQSISDRLGRLGDFPWARMWVAISTLAGGTFVGGAFALIPFLSANPTPSVEAELIYFAALGVVALVARLSATSAATAHHERAESISAIKADFDKHLLGSFEDPQKLSSRA